MRYAAAAACTALLLCTFIVGVLSSGRSSGEPANLDIGGLAVAPAARDLRRELSLAARRQRHEARRRRGHFIPLTPRERPPGAPLLRFAVFGDTHYWSKGLTRTAWEKHVASQPVRDGLLVEAVDAVLPRLLQQLSAFAASGGDFAVHAGDAVCGGSSFHQTPAEFTNSLHTYRELELCALGSWPVLHIPGNHDLHPGPRGVGRAAGTAAWREVMCANQTHAVTSRRCAAGMPNYSSLRLPGWRILLLDSQDGLLEDSDGHGHIGPVQLSWLRAELEESKQARERVILIMHQLLVEPPGDGWVERTQDFVDNRCRAPSPVLPPCALSVSAG